MFAKFGKDLVSRDLIEAVKKVMDQPDEDKDDQTEELKGGQVKLDKNRNGKLDSQDFKMLRGEKKVNEAEASYQSSAKYRGKVGDFKPKASDVGQGRKIAGKMGKYGKQPDDDEKMVEPPKDQTVGDVKTDPSAVVPGHSTMAAKLHLASLPKDKEGNPIVKGARKVSAADLVAKRKAMMAGRKNEEYVEEGMEDTLHPAGAALLKHIKPQHHNLYKPHLTKDTFNGSYKDRTAVLKAAKDAGHLKMDLRKQNEEVTEKVDPNVRTTDTLKGRIAGGDSNQHTSYKVKLETKGTGSLDRIKSAAKSAFDRVKNETMMGKAGATSEAKKLDKEGY